MRLTSQKLSDLDLMDGGDEFRQNTSGNGIEDTVGYLIDNILKAREVW